MTHKGQIQVYAIVRFDNTQTPEISFSVKEIVSSIEIAQREVERLNAPNGHLGCRYWWQATRLYPDGLAAGPLETSSDG